jgi:hypothetical protein
LQHHCNTIVGGESPVKTRGAKKQKEEGEEVEVNPYAGLPKASFFMTEQERKLKRMVEREEVCIIVTPL